jgi:hypothetical protein
METLLCTQKSITYIDRKIRPRLAFSFRGITTDKMIRAGKLRRANAASDLAAWVGKEVD